MNIDFKEKSCRICKELREKIELAGSNGEAIEFEVLMYQHKVKGACSDEQFTKYEIQAA